MAGEQQMMGPPDARRVVQALRALGDEQAPSLVLPTVMTRLGLADSYTTVTTPAGQVYVAYNAEGMSAVMRVEESAEFEQLFRARFGRPAYRVAAAPPSLARALDRWARGERGPALRVDLRGLSPFERDVLLKAREIPRGEVRPYSWVAREIGRTRAVRAVGTALGHNPLPLVIPCHRVVRSDGYVGAYSMGGPEVKRAVLHAEGVAPEQLEALARQGVRYIGSDTTHVYCFPTCRHARRIGDRHRVSFRSEAQAATAGYRPCAICRPLAAAG